MLTVRVAADAKVRTSCLEHEATDVCYSISVLDHVGEIAGQSTAQCIEMRRVVQNDHSHLPRVVPCQCDVLVIKAALVPDQSSWRGSG